MTSDFAHGGVSDSISVTDSWVCLHSPDNSVKLANSANNVGLTLDNRGLTYADGFFTTMGVVDGLILWQDYHHQRLISHGQALQLDIDDQAVLWSLQMHAQQLQQGMLKLIVTALRKLFVAMALRQVRPVARVRFGSNLQPC